MGAQRLKVVVFFFDTKLLDNAISGAWHFDLGAEGAVGTASIDGKMPKSPDSRYRAFKLAEGGAAATVTIRLARARPFLN